MKIKSKFLLFFVVFFLLFGCNQDGFLKHHVSLNSPNGLDTQYIPSTHQLKISQNKPYMLFFFGTSCGACVAQVPIINEIREKYGDSFEIYGIFGPSLGFDKDIKIINDHKIQFEVISDKISVDYFKKAVGGIMGVPAMFIFDKDGNLKKRFIGVTPKKALEETIKSVI